MADEENQIRDRIRERLRADKVKLWLPPFTTPAGLKGQHPSVRLCLTLYSDCQ